MAQVGEDVLEELQRDRLGGRERVALDRAAAGGGELDGGAEGVVGLRGDAHVVPILYEIDWKDG